MTSFNSRATRRSLSVMTAAITAVLIALPTTAQAETPPQRLPQVPGYYRMVLGDFEVTALYDGHLGIAPKLLMGASKHTIQKLLSRHFMPTTGSVQTAVNAFLVDMESKLVLIDTGAGTCFGPTSGRVPANLRKAGYTRAQVDAVLLTHLHPDHACGLVTPAGDMAFPNAEVWVSESEADYWLSDKVEAKAPDNARPLFDMAQASVAPYVDADQFNTFVASKQLMPDISVIAAPGHTPGHTAYLVDGGAAHDLLIWGDIVHNFAVQFPHPEVAITFDTDSSQAIKTRKRLFSRAARQELWVAGAHLPFPGLGHVRADGDGYAWVPIRYHPVSADH